MKKTSVLTLLCTPEPQFLLPAIAAVAVGSALGYYENTDFNFLLAALALVSIVLLNAGSNMLNDYYDHLSGNDWLNMNPTKFGGGSRYIQNGIITPEAMRTAGLIAISAGAVIGLVIVIITKSLFILTLGLVGFAGGLFWTAPPVKLCYRLPGEPHIFFMFGILPAFGAYYLQTNRLSITPLVPAAIIGIHIALVALINSIPDRDADEAVDKKTFVVRFGLPAAISLYRLSISFSYVISLSAAAFCASGAVKAAAAGHLFTLPVAFVCLWQAKIEKLSQSGIWIPNAFTILLYVLCGLFMTAAILFAKFNYAN